MLVNLMCCPKFAFRGRSFLLRLLSFQLISRDILIQRLIESKKRYLCFRKIRKKNKKAFSFFPSNHYCLLLLHICTVSRIIIVLLLLLMM